MLSYFLCGIYCENAFIISVSSVCYLQFILYVKTESVFFSFFLNFCWDIRPYSVVFYVDALLFEMVQDIIRLPRLFRFLQKPLAQFISTARAPKSKEGYASIGGGSPLRQITDAQVWIVKGSLFMQKISSRSLSFCGALIFRQV